MEKTFENITKDVVSRFLQNILVIDDKAYPSEKEIESNMNAFDARTISNVFAKNGKLCTIYAPSSECDICNCSALFAKSDVVILDWFLDLKTKDHFKSDETDADVDDPRGFYTKYLIGEIIMDAKDEKLKLIIVYTGETDLNSITEEIYKAVKTPDNNFEYGNCRVYSSNILILVRAKYNGEEQYKHFEDLKDKVVKYEELPDFIIREFSKQVNGILPNFALSAISVIREQTSKILGVYSNETDSAYLGHKVLLENQNDAQHLLVKIFGESMSDLIESLNTNIDNWIPLWIDDKYPSSETIKIGDKQIVINGSLLKELLSDNMETFKDKIGRLFNGVLSGKEAMKNSTCLFSKDKISANRSNVQFATLTHHKNVFGAKPERPMLTLGTVVSYGENYFVCIQQRCDSIRLKGERKFLFLPLTNTDGNMHIVINKDNCLNVSNVTYALKTIKFKPQEGEDRIYAKSVEKDQGQSAFVFESIYGEKFGWVLELKDLHAQRIVDAYCSMLSRVGLDESEWLRLLK